MKITSITEAVRKQKELEQLAHLTNAELAKQRAKAEEKQRELERQQEEAQKARKDLEYQREEARRKNEELEAERAAARQRDEVLYEFSYIFLDVMKYL